MAGKLFIVGTPIGNLEDISPRAVRILAEADLIAAEDTRHTGLLLQHLGLKKPQISYHKFNEKSRQQELLQRLHNGSRIALVSDAGMPGISDPGERLIRLCVEEGVDMEVIPGPSAVLHALAASGLKSTPFYFGGFLPVKGGARQKEIARAVEREATSIYFESPHRILKTLEDCRLLLPEGRRVCVARELTKKFEECKTGTPEQVLEYFRARPPKGEITFLLAGANDYSSSICKDPETMD